MSMKKTDRLIRVYIIVLLLSLAIDVNLFPIKALCVDSIPLNLFIILIGAGFPIVLFRDFMYFVRKRSLLFFIALLFICSGLISVFLSPFQMLYGLKWLFNYIAFTSVSFLLLFLLSRDERLGLFLLKAIIGLALALAMVALVETSFDEVYRFLADTFRSGEYQFVDGRPRPAATLSHPNVFSCFMALGIFLLLHLKEHSGLSMVFFLSSVLLLSIALGLSGSRNAMFTLLIPLLPMVFNRNAAKNALAVVVIALFSLIVLSPAASRFTQLFETDLLTMDTPIGQANANFAKKQAVKDTDDKLKTANVPPKYMTVDVRLMLWQSALAMFRDHPFFGLGPGGYNLALKDYASERLLSVEKQKIEKDYLHAHNLVLNVLAEFGTSGVVIGLFFISYLLLHMVRTHGVFPPSTAHAALLGIGLSFMPDAFLYDRFYMVLSMTLLFFFTLQSKAFCYLTPVEETTGEQNT